MIKLRKVLSSLVAVGVSGLLLAGCGKGKVVDTVITDDTSISGRVEQTTDYESSSLEESESESFDETDKDSYTRNPVPSGEPTIEDLVRKPFNGDYPDNIKVTYVVQAVDLDRSEAGVTSLSYSAYFDKARSQLIRDTSDSYNVRYLEYDDYRWYEYGGTENLDINYVGQVEKVPTEEELHAALYGLLRSSELWLPEKWTMTDNPENPDTYVLEREISPDVFSSTLSDLPFLQIDSSYPFKEGLYYSVTATYDKVTRYLDRVHIYLPDQEMTEGVGTSNVSIEVIYSDAGVTEVKIPESAREQRE